MLGAELGVQPAVVHAVQKASKATSCHHDYIKRTRALFMSSDARCRDVQDHVFRDASLQLR